MNKPMIRAQFRIHHDEDPVLYTILEPLSGIARSRRVRHLVRAGVLVENGTHGQITPAAVKSHSRASARDEPRRAPSETASKPQEEDHGNQLPAEFFAPPTSIGSRL